MLINLWVWGCSRPYIEPHFFHMCESIQFNFAIFKKNDTGSSQLGEPLTAHPKDQTKEENEGYSMGKMKETQNFRKMKKDMANILIFSGLEREAWLRPLRKNQELFVIH